MGVATIIINGSASRKRFVNCRGLARSKNMRTCSSCGIPRAFNHFLEWRSDGTLIGKGRFRFPTAFLESGEFEDLIEGVSDSLGIPVDRFVIQAQKDMGKAFYERLPVRHLKRVPSKRYLRPEWIAKLVIGLAGRDAATLGIGRVALERYRAGESVELRWRNYCLIPMLVGSAMGVYEVLEEMPSSKADYSVEGDDLVIRMSHAADRPASESRLHMEGVVPGAGPVSYDRCAGCGSPLLASETFSWDVNRGVITNRKTGAREFVASVPAVSAVLRELEKEIGEGLPRLVFDIQKKLAARKLEGVDAGDRGAFWEGYLSEMALRGFGYPGTFEIKDDSVYVEIHNAYNQILYAARLAGALERITGGETAISWDKREPFDAVYTISAGVSGRR